MQLLAGIFRIHAPDRAVEIPHVLDGAGAEAGRLGGDANHGEAARRQDARQAVGIAQWFHGRHRSVSPFEVICHSEAGGAFRQAPRDSQVTSRAGTASRRRDAALGAIEQVDRAQDLAAPEDR
jgi:hypothetical protein